MKVLFLLLSFFLSGLFICCVINDEHGNLNRTSFVACDDACPVFPGGDAEMMKFIEKNIHYPQDAIEAGLEGKVVVKFTVTKSGSICNFSIVESVCKTLDEEAIRIVRSLPKFVPGKIDGALVDIEYTLPVNFRLPSPTKTNH